MTIIKSSIQSNGLVKTIPRVTAHALDILLDTFYYRFKTVKENRLLFMSVPDYSDNARALYDYMMEQHLDSKYELIWSIADSRKYRELSKKGVKCTKRYAILPSIRSHRFWYYGRTAKIIFHTHGHPFDLTRKTGQTIFGLWHGGMGFKGPMGYREYCTDDYILTSGSGEASLDYSTTFHGCDRNILLPFGFPRNDLMFKEKYIEQFDSLYGTKILWMPTFRETGNKAISSHTIDSETDLPILRNIADVARLNDYLIEKNTHIFITNHPLRKPDTKISVKLSNIHTLNTREIEDSGIQLYEIFNHFDAMISDYSSVTFDYLYLDRPIGYTLDDFEEYKRSRGFAMDNPLDYMPGHHIYTYDDLVKFISDVVDGIDEYSCVREKVRNEVGLAKGGETSEMILRYLDLS